MKNILKKIQDMECTGVNLGGCQWRIRRISSIDMIRQGEGLFAALPQSDEDRIELASIAEMPDGAEKEHRMGGFKQRKMQEQLGKINELIAWQEAVLMESVIGVAEEGETSTDGSHWQPAKFVRGDAAPFKEGDSIAEMPFKTLSLAERAQLVQIIIDHSNGGAEALARVARFRGGS